MFYSRTPWFRRVENFLKCTFTFIQEKRAITFLCTGSDYQDALGRDRERSGSPTLQHSHSDISTHHSLDSASMSPVYDSYLQLHQVTRMPSRHQKSVTTGQLDWPLGNSRGGEGSGRRRGDWRGESQPQGGAVQEPGGVEALQKRLRIDVNAPVSLIECVCVCVCLSVSLGGLVSAVYV